jgi:histidinol dehydrogenase
MIEIYDNEELYFRSRAQQDIEEDPRIRARVEAIVDRVRKQGDSALLALAKELDGIELEAGELRVSPERLARSAREVRSSTRELFARATTNIRRFHERQREEGFLERQPDGTRLGQRLRPLSSVGVYVPGGEASYPSSVLMNVIPAKIAGVPRIVACTPPGALDRSRELAAAMVTVGVDEVYRVGGAQAVAAMAYGTETITPVDKIVGPGNAYVAQAKKLVFGRVGIDSIAGPSEIVVLADGSANPRFVAADLLSQAEHGSGEERAILVTTSRNLAEAARAEIVAQVETLPRRDSVQTVLRKYGAAIVVDSMERAVAVVDRIAPEHLEILTKNAPDLVDRIHHAGAIFVGESTPVPVGDFYAGPNHVLPTGTTARFASPLGVYDFMKRSSVLQYSRERLRHDRDDIEAFARTEGFEAHARAISIRFES